HRPQELHIAVNGFPLGSKKIKETLKRQAFVLSSSESVNFIEVFSEEETRLLLLPVGEWPPRNQAELMTRVVLSDDRTLELKLTYRDLHPEIQLVYCDPLLQGENESLVDFEVEKEGQSRRLIDPKSKPPATEQGVIATETGPETFEREH